MFFSGGCIAARRLAVSLARDSAHVRKSETKILCLLICMWVQPRAIQKYGIVQSMSRGSTEKDGLLTHPTPARQDMPFHGQGRTDSY